MRISQTMISRNIIKNIDRNRERLNDIQEKMSSGKNIELASDNPAAYAKSAKLKRIMDNNNQYLKNIYDVRSWLDVTESSLEGIHDLILDSKNIAIQQASDPIPDDQRQTMMNQLDTIISSVTDLLNTSHMNQKIFGGTVTGNGNVFDTDGNYSGDDGEITRNIGKDQNISINISGQKILDSEIYQSLTGLREAIEGGTTSDIEQAIDSLDTTSENIIGLITDVGGKGNQLEMNIDRLETANLNISSILSQIEDVDMAETLMQYNMEEIAYRAALQTGGNVMQNSLLDFLR